MAVEAEKEDGEVGGGWHPWGIVRDDLGTYFGKAEQT